MKQVVCLHTPCAARRSLVFLLFLLLAFSFHPESVPTTQAAAFTGCDYPSLQNEIPQAECEALVALYDQTGGPEWTNRTGWRTTSTLCDWYGVTCSGGQVVAISLSDNQLSGTLPDLRPLTNLTYLSLSDNQLSGTISNLATLTRLTTLYLSNNQLSGTLPDLSPLTNLAYLSLSNNQFSGSIPDLSSLTNLATLYLSNNQLSGTLPDLSPLTRLTTCSLSNNQLSGTLPDLRPLTNLTSLSLSNNQLSGAIPDLSTLTRLSTLSLADNQLSGTLPDLSPLTNLTYLRLSNNQLSGTLPDLSSLTNLTYLYLSNNQLSGTLPDLRPLTNLRDLRLENNQLSGTLPDLRPLTNLTTLYLSNNQFSGPIPELTTLVSLAHLRLANNQLSGPMPDMTTLTSLVTLVLDNNQLSGPVPDMSALTGLTHLYLANNQLTSIPPGLGSLPSLTILSLSNNQLTSIPPELGNLSSLTTLSLANNQLTTIPPELMQLSSLQVLVLSNNQLSGTLPDFSPLTSLTHLYLSNNQLSGTLPDFSPLTSLTHLYLSNNQLSGTLPDFSPLTSLTDLDLSVNHLDGPVVASSLPISLTLLNLSHNHLSSSIPDASLPISLTLLNLSHNHLSGPIPDLSMLASLTDLILTGNQLSGDIPPALSTLTNLVNLDLGYNQLTASDPALLALLESPGNRDPDWSRTQTIPPTDIAAEALTDTMVRVNWSPIPYTGNGGFYQVWYAVQPAGAYTPAKSTTVDKNTPGYIVTGLQPETTYSFLVRTFTPAHTRNQNALTSTRSLEAAATTFPPSPEISVLDWNGAVVADESVTPLDLGITSIGVPMTRTFTVRNLGTTALELTNPITIPSGFTLNRSLHGATVTAGGSITFDLTFEATHPGIFSGELSFGTSDSNENPFNFPIRARSIAPDIQVANWNSVPVTSSTTTLIQVGQTAVGKTLSRRFKVSNSGEADLILTDLTVPPRYTVARTFAITTVRPGSSTTFDLALTTASAGVFSGTVALASNDPDENPFVFTVTGTVSGTVPDPFDCPAALAVTEGMAHLKADTARTTYQVDGSGVTVGVIANSYDAATLGTDGKLIATRAISDVHSGDLPGDGNPCGYTTPVRVIRDGPSGHPGPGGDEGRAVMQIIHDIAPGARLLFASGVGETATVYDLAEAIRLLHQAGADIIVDTMYYGVQPFYQDGPVAVAVAEVVEAGGISFTTAGNFNKYTRIDDTPRGLSYETLAYRPTACPAGLTRPDGTPVTLEGDCHNFLASTGPPDATARYTAAPASQVRFHLQWGEPWYGVTTDLDLYAIDESGTVLATSTSDNLSTRLPYESLTITTTTTTTTLAADTADAEASQPFLIVVNRVNRADRSDSERQGTPQFKYIVDGMGIAQAEYYAPDDPDISPDIFGPTIFGHRGANAVISVSAVPYTTISHVEDSSSRGLPWYYFGPINGDETPADRLDIPESRQKPDMAATDGNATTFYGRPPHSPENPDAVWRFDGTSAAAAHAAGVAALVLQEARKNHIPIGQQTMELLLETTASRIEGSPTEATGAGLIQADAAVRTMTIQPFEVLVPGGDEPLQAGPHTTPQAATIHISKPNFGLLQPDHFTVQVGSSEAEVLSVVELPERYILEVAPPVQKKNDLYDLSITVVNRSSPVVRKGGVLYGETVARIRPTTLHTYLDKQAYRRGDPVRVAAVLFNDYPITSARVTAVMERQYQDAGGNEEVPTRGFPVQVRLYDDGFHGDGMAGDGVYAGTVTSNYTRSHGDYRIDVFASDFSLPNGGEETRLHTRHTVRVSESGDQPGVNVGVAVEEEEEPQGQVFLPLLTAK